MEKSTGVTTPITTLQANLDDPSVMVSFPIEPIQITVVPVNPPDLVGYSQYHQLFQHPLPPFFFLATGTSFQKFNSTLLIRLIDRGFLSSHSIVMVGELK